MNKAEAFDLIERYIQGWKQNDLTKIITCLTEDCVVIESHGPTYLGVRQIEAWFSCWLAANSYIERWDISSFYFCEMEQTAFVEWDFSCISYEKRYSLRGISIIKLAHKKISFLQEYRMTNSPYAWSGNLLRSD